MDDDLDTNDPEPTNEELDKMEDEKPKRRGRPPFKVKEETEVKPKRRGRRKGWKRKASGLDATLSNLLAEAQSVISSLTAAHIKVGELRNKLLGETINNIEEVTPKDNGIFSVLAANLGAMRNLAEGIEKMSEI